MNYLKKTTYFVLLVFFSFSLKAQDQYANASERAESSTQTNFQSIHVSNELYQEILAWLSKDDEEIRLDDHLRTSSIKPEETRTFLEDYYSGAEPKISPNQKGKTSEETAQFGDCDCKNIIPRETSSSYSEGNLGPINGEEHGGGSGAMEWEYQYEDEGLGFEHRHDFDIDDEEDKILTHSHNRTVYHRFEILLLCTSEGLRSNKCNCDKQIISDGEFEFDIYQEMALQYLSTWISVDYRIGFLGMTLERDVESFDPRKLINHEWIEARVYQTGGSRLKDPFGNHINGASIDWQGTWAQSPFALAYDRMMLFNDADFTSTTPLTTKSIFLDNLDNPDYNSSHPDYGDRHESYTNWAIHNSNNNQIPIPHNTRLRANIPRIYLYMAAVSSQYFAEGNHGYGRHRSEGNFWTAYKIPEQTTGFTPGETEDERDRCCNDEFSGFIYDIIDDAQRETQIKSDLVTSLNQTYAGLPDLEYEYGVGVTLSQDDQVESITADKGFAYSITSCGNCDEFDLLTTDDNGIRNFWNPQLLVTGNLCNGGTILVSLQPGGMPPTGGTQYTVQRYNGWTWDNAFTNGSAYANPQSIAAPLASLSDPGEYKFEFISPGGCKTLALVVVEDCESQSGGVDCIRNRFSRLPNPVQATPEHSNPDFHITWAITSSHCPAFFTAGKNSFRIEIYDLRGTLIYGPEYFSNQNIGSLTIPFSVWPSNGGVMASYLVVVTFADFTSFSDIIQVVK